MTLYWFTYLKRSCETDKWRVETISGNGEAEDKVSSEGDEFEYDIFDML
jgi:hypothetical protein